MVSISLCNGSSILGPGSISEAAPTCLLRWGLGWIPVPFLLHELPDFPLLPLLSPGASSSKHQERVHRESSAPSQERPGEPQNGRAREQVEEEQEEVDDHIDRCMEVQATELLNSFLSPLIQLLVMHGVCLPS